MTNYSFPEYIDSTMMEDALCDRKFFNKWVRQWQPIGGSVHLTAGGAYAAGLHAFRMSFYSPGPDWGVYDRAIGAGWRAIVDAWGDFQAPLDSPKQLWRVLEAFDAHLRKWPPAIDPVQPHMVRNLPAAEISFALPMDVNHPETGDPINYVGRIDLVGEFQQALWVIDDKTCTQLGKTWADKWHLRGQFQGYMSVARDYGYSVTGAIIRGACFYANRIECVETFVHWRPWLAEEWWESLNFRVGRLVDCYRSGYWPKAFNEACTMFSGCDFRSLCLHPHEHTLAPVEYERHIWDPVNRVDRREDISPP